MDSSRFKTIPGYPIRDDTEAYYQLPKTVGLLIIFSQGGMTRLNTLISPPLIRNPLGGNKYLLLSI